MSKMVILRGLPSSGKSTYAINWVKDDPKNRIRICRDELRFMLDERYYVHGVEGRESNVTLMQNAIIHRALHEGKDIVIDNCNLAPIAVSHLRRMARKYNAEVQTVLFEVPIAICLKRNAELPKDEKPAGGHSHGGPGMDF